MTQFCQPHHLTAERQKGKEMEHHKTIDEAIEYIEGVIGIESAAISPQTNKVIEVGRTVLRNLEAMRKDCEQQRGASVTMGTIELENGKYTLTQDEGSFKALRYGEEWRNLSGDNLIHALFWEIISLTSDINEVMKINNYLINNDPNIIQKCADQIQIYRNKLKNENGSEQTNSELRFAIEALERVMS